jgi:serine protease DegQ
VVTRVYPGSAGAAAGLKVGDVILAANGQRIDNAEALRNFQGLQAANARVALDVRRDGKPLQLATGLREAPKALQGAQLDARLAARASPSCRNRCAARAWPACWWRAWRAAAAIAQNRIAQRRRGAGASSGEFSDLTGFRAAIPRNPSNWSCACCATAARITY